MHQRISKKNILIYIFLFILLGTINNKELNMFKFPKINKIEVSGLSDEKI